MCLVRDGQYAQIEAGVALLIILKAHMNILWIINV